MIEASIETFLFWIVKAHVRRNENSILKASSMHATDGKRNVVFTFNFTFLFPQKSRFVVRFSNLMICYQRSGDVFAAFRS